MLGDRTQASALCAAALAWTKSKVVAHLPGIAKSLWIDQFAREQFVGELAFSKEKLLERGSRAQLRFDLFGLLLNALDQFLPPLQQGVHPRRGRLLYPHPLRPPPPTPAHRYSLLQ